MPKPLLIIVTGRPGAGKTTLSERMSREWHLPVVSRDRIKEGYVHTTGKSHDELPANGNLLTNNTFFSAIQVLIDNGVSCIAEAAFQHKVWAERLEPFKDKSRIHIVLCHVDAQLALDRFCERGLQDVSRIRFHGDAGVKMLLAGMTPRAGSYDEPHLDLPTWRVDTTDGYRPPLDALKAAILDG